MVTKLDLSFYREEFTNIVDLHHLLKIKCNDISYFMETDFKVNHSFCSGPLNQIEAMLDECRANNAEWFVKRQKRSLPLVLGGALIGALGFNLISNNHLREFMGQLTAMSNENRLRDLKAEIHTTLLNQAFNQISNITSHIEAISAGVAEFKTEFANYIEHERAILDLHSLQIHFNLILNHLSLVVTHYRDHLRDFLNTIAITHKNPSNPNVIPPKVFFQELLNIKNAVSSLDLDLPLPLVRESLAQFYQIVSPSSGIIDNTLIIKFSIPLVSTKKYILYKGTSMPYRIKDNLFSYIVPHHEYVALDTFYEKYAAISEQEISNCFHVNITNLVCKQTFPILAAYKTKTCEINLLRSMNISDECNVRVANLTSELWIKLRRPNTYIFTFPQKVLLQVDCPIHKEKTHLRGSGIISYSPGCTIKTDDVEIQAFQTLESEVINQFIPTVKLDLDVPNDVIKMTQAYDMHIPTINIPHIVNFGEKDKLNEISSAFLQLKLLEQSLREQTTPSHLKRNVSNQFLVLCIIIFATLCIVAKLVYRHYLKIRRRRQNSNAIIYISKPSTDNAPTPIVRSSHPNPTPITRNVYPNLRNSRFYINESNNANNQNNASPIFDLPNDN